METNEWDKKIALSEFHDRYKLIIDGLGKNPHELAKDFGYGRATKIYTTMAGDTKPGTESLMDMCKAYPQINMNFLLKGEGVPFLQDSHTRLTDEMRRANREVYMRFIEMLDTELQQALSEKQAMMRQIDELNALVQHFMHRQSFTDVVVPSLVVQETKEPEPVAPPKPRKPRVPAPPLYDEFGQRVKRPRGRPRKNPADMPVVETEPKEKRRPGRPRKIVE